MVRTCAPCASDVGMMDPERCNLQEKFKRPYPAVRDLWYRLGYAKPCFVGGFQAEMGKRLAERVGWNCFFWMRKMAWCKRERGDRMKITRWICSKIWELEARAIGCSRTFCLEILRLGQHRPLGICLKPFFLFCESSPFMVKLRVCSGKRP